MTDQSSLATHDFSPAARAAPLWCGVPRNGPAYFDTRVRAWVLTRYRDAIEALRSSRMGQLEQQRRIDVLGAEDQQALEPLRRIFGMWAGQGNDCDHRAFIRLTRPALSGRATERLRPRVQAAMDETLASALAGPELDIVRDLARPFAMRAIGEALGIPIDQLTLVQQAVLKVAGLFGVGAREQLYEAQEGILCLHEFLLSILARKEVAPEGLLARFADPEAGFDQDFVIAQGTLLLAAGFYPTSTLLANGAQLLFEHPEQRTALQDDRRLLAHAIEEMARFGGPPFSTRKVATMRITFGDQVVSEGESVVLMLLAANHDPNAFAEPHRFDVARKDWNKSLAFGTAPYHCVGRSLVRLEGEIFFDALLHRLPGLRPIAHQADWIPLPPYGRELRTLRAEASLR